MKKLIAFLAIIGSLYMFSSCTEEHVEPNSKPPVIPTNPPDPF